MKDHATALDPLLQWLNEQGFSDAQLEARGDLLIVKLSAALRTRLLKSTLLREQVLARVKDSGFARVALDCT